MSGDGITVPIDVDLGEGLAELNAFIDSMKGAGKAVVDVGGHLDKAVSYTHLTLPTIHVECRSRWSPYN